MDKSLNRTDSDIMEIFKTGISLLQEGKDTQWGVTEGALHGMSEPKIIGGELLRDAEIFSGKAKIIQFICTPHLNKEVIERLGGNPDHIVEIVLGKISKGVFYALIEGDRCSAPALANLASWKLFRNQIDYKIFRKGNIQQRAESLVFHYMKPDIEYSLFLDKW